MNTSIRQVEDLEMLEALYPLDQYCLSPSPPFQNKEEWISIIRERKGITCFALFESEEPVSIAVSTAMTQNIRGKLYPASGVWGVSTHPSARRKGYCRQVMGRLMAAERESGKIFSNLYPFRESFYERLGYVTIPLPKIVKFMPQALSPLLAQELSGEIELKLIGETYETYRQYLKELRQNRHGMAFFDFPDQASASRNRQWVAIARFDGKIEGLMLYALQGDAPTKYRLFSPRFYYQTSRARYLLLNWISRHIDQADRVEIWLPADEYPETWLADLQVKVESAERAPMIRILDIAGLSGMAVGQENFVVRINDPLCPWNEGTWDFESCDGQLQVTKATKAASAEISLNIQGLSALIAGTHDPEVFSIRGWGNPNHQMQAVLRGLFPKSCPYLHEYF
jgi:predicted acetyltransferase